jgi:AraC-like DNA-binding protein
VWCCDGASADALGAAFKRERGMSPSEYRAQKAPLTGESVR